MSNSNEDNNAKEGEAATLLDETNNVNVVIVRNRNVDDGGSNGPEDPGENGKTKFKQNYFCILILNAFMS